MSAVGIVEEQRLNSFLSSPPWSPEQQAEAQELLDALEDGLASALYGTRITPEPMVEMAPIIAKSGQVATRFPVFAVTALNGEPLVDGALPAGWRLDRHRIYSPAVAGMELLAGFGQPRIAVPYLPYSGAVTVAYDAGWGAERDLVLAILRKAKNIWLNNNDDSIVARATSADPPQPLPSEDWSDDELAPLGRFRRLDLT